MKKPKKVLNSIKDKKPVTIFNSKESPLEEKFDIFFEGIKNLSSKKNKG